MRRVAALWWVAAGCASALHDPRSIDALAPHHGNGRSADELMRAAAAAWAQRPAPGQAAAAQELYLDAALAEPRLDAVLGALRAESYRLEHESGLAKAPLAEREVELGQLCQRLHPESAECDYRLAIALGQQARERKATGKDALGHMTDLLHRAIERDERLDAAGAHRVLALVLLRAPAWPVGPGDPDAALTEAKAAVQLFPDNAENQLAFAEALAGNDDAAGAHAAFAKALELATAAQAAGEPEAGDWLARAKSGADKTAP